MAKLLVEIDMGNDISAEELMDDIEKNGKDWFPVGRNYISIDATTYLKKDPTDNDFYLFKLHGVIDDEEASDK